MSDEFLSPNSPDPAERKPFTNVETANPCKEAKDAALINNSSELHTAGNSTDHPTPKSVAYEDIFSGDWSVALQRVDAGRQGAAHLAQIFSERAQIEEAYATSLDRLADKLTISSVEGRGVAAAVNAIRLEAMRRSEQHLELVESLRKDVIRQTLEETVANHLMIFKQIQTDGVIISTNLQNAQEAFRQATDQYVTKCRQADEAASDCREVESANPTLRSRFAMKALKLCNVACSAEAEYYKCINTLNVTSEIYNRQMQIILRSLRDMDQKRISCMKDALRKFMVYNTSLTRNVQYDQQSTIMAIEGIDRINDADCSVQSRGSFRRQIEVVEPKLWTSLTDTSQPKSAAASGAVKLNLAHSNAPRCGDNQIGSCHEDQLTARSEKVQPETFTALAPSQANCSPRTAQPHSPPDSPLPTLSSKNLHSSGISLVEKVVQSAALHLHLAAPHAVRSFVDTAESFGISSASKLWDNYDLLAPLSNTKRRSRDDTALPSLEACAVPTSAVMEPIMAKYKSLIESICDNGGLNSVDFNDLLSTLRRDFTNSLYRYVFSCCLYHRMLTQSGGPLPTLNALKKMSSVCEVALDIGETQHDVWTGRCIMLCSQCFYAFGSVANSSENVTGNKGNCVGRRFQAVPNKEHGKEYHYGMTEDVRRSKVCDLEGAAKDVSTPHPAVPPAKVKLYMQYFLHHHIIWNKVQFWEDALLVTISEQLQGKALKRRWESLGTTQADALYEDFLNRHYAVKKLPSFAIMMTSFGILKSQVASLFQKVCIQHDLGQTYCSSLLKCLDDAKESDTEALPFDCLARLVGDAQEETDNETDSETDGETDNETDGETDNANDGEIDNETDCKTDRETDGQSPGEYAPAEPTISQAPSCGSSSQESNPMHQKIRGKA